MVEMKPCPVDRGKLLIGLECCRRSDPERCEDCPYNCNFIADHYYGGALTEDALTYIGWLEERVKTLETNLTNALGTIERSLDELPPSPYLILCKDEETSKIYVSAEGQPSDFLFLALSGLHKVRMTASLNFYDADAFRKALMDDDGGDCTARNGENALNQDEGTES